MIVVKREKTKKRESSHNKFPIHMNNANISIVAHEIVKNDIIGNPPLPFPIPMRSFVTFIPLLLLN